MTHRLGPILLLVSVLLGMGAALPDVRSADGAARSAVPVAPRPPASPEGAPAIDGVAATIRGSRTALDLATGPVAATPTPPQPESESESPPLPRSNVAYGPDPAHRLDIHPPPAANGLAVLWLHPGGWTSGDRTGTGPVVDQLVADGAIVFSADYRLTPDHPFPAQIHDVKRAIRWIKANRSEFPHRRLLVAGASAGGHLAALAATSAGDLEPTDLPPDLAAHDATVDGAVSLSGPMDLTRFWQADHPWAKPLSDGFLACDSTHCDRARMLDASPTHWVDPSDPPLYLAAGTADPLVTAADNADRMWDAIHTTGDPTRCRYDRVDGGTHNLWDTLDLARLRQFLTDFDLVRASAAVLV